MGTRQTSSIILLVAGTLVQTHHTLKKFEPFAPTLCESTPSIRLPMKGNVCYSFVHTHIHARAHTHTQTPKFISVHLQMVLGHENMC